jgi:hypothetical protein
LKTRMDKVEAKYCFNCHKTLHSEDPHDNFCSWSCFEKYRLDREKWERLKQEKEKENARGS